MIYGNDGRTGFSDVQKNTQEETNQSYENEKDFGECSYINSNSFKKPVPDVYKRQLLLRLQTEKILKPVRHSRAVVQAAVQLAADVIDLI